MKRRIEAADYYQFNLLHKHLEGMLTYPVMCELVQLEMANKDVTYGSLQGLIQDIQSLLDSKHAIHSNKTVATNLFWTLYGVMESIINAYFPTEQSDLDERDITSLEILYKDFVRLEGVSGAETAIDHFFGESNIEAGVQYSDYEDFSAFLKFIKSVLINNEKGKLDPDVVRKLVQFLNSFFIEKLKSSHED